jgi:hypothetical protein
LLYELDLEALSNYIHLIPAQKKSGRYNDFYGRASSRVMSQFILAGTKENHCTACPVNMAQLFWIYMLVSKS